MKTRDRLLKALQSRIAALEADIEELAFCEGCGESCEKMTDNNCYPPRWCHTCQQSSVKEVVRLTAELAAAQTVVRAAEAWKEWIGLAEKCGYLEAPEIALAKAVSEMRERN